MVRDMGVKKNIHIENWAGRRENLEHYFKYSRGNWARLAIFGVAVPVLCYNAIVAEFVRIYESLFRFRCDALTLKYIRFDAIRFASLYRKLKVKDRTSDRLWMASSENSCLMGANLMNKHSYTQFNYNRAMCFVQIFSNRNSQ